MRLTRRQFILAVSGIAGVGMAAPPGISAATWRRGADAPTRRSEVAAAVLGGKIYVVGGFGGGTGGLVEAYDPIGDAWQARAPLPTGRDHHATAVVGDSIYVIGGRINGSYGMNLGVVARQGRLFVLAGGQTPGGSASAATEILEP